MGSDVKNTGSRLVSELQTTSPKSFLLKPMTARFSVLENVFSGRFNAWDDFWVVQVAKKPSQLVFVSSDEAFHQMTLPVQMPVIVGGFLAVRAGRNDRHHTQFQDVLAKLLGIVPFVGQYVLASITGDQLLRLGDVVLLPSGQDESQGVAQAVHAHVNLGAEPAAAPAQGLGGLATLFGGAPAAQGCARTTVLSMIRYSRSASSQKC